CERESGDLRVKVLDFGIAKLVAGAASLGHMTGSVGTPLYMAPEQFLPGHQVAPATDIYALGMLAYTLLVGVEYWDEDLAREGNVFAFAAVAVRGPSEPASARAARQNTELPCGFDAWFARCTALRPEHRFDCATEAISELASVLAVPLPASPRASMVSLHEV